MKPRFRLENMQPHYRLGNRLYLQPVNAEAYQMIKDRDNGRIKDFPMVIYLNQ